MFSVPGWSVTTSVATQSKSGKNALNTNGGPASKAPKLSRSDKTLKRKRSQQLGKVDEGNVQQYWDEVIDGKSVVKPSEKSEKSKDVSKRANGEIDRSEHKKKPKQKEHQDVNDSTGNGTKVKQPATKAGPPVASAVRPTTTSAGESVQKLTPLQASMRAKLTSARFRHLNEQLYTKPSLTSLKLFTETPSLFEEYHTGFRQQVAVWPENPVNAYIEEIRLRGQQNKHFDKKRTKPQTGPPPLPRSSGTTTIADLGCGDAMLAQTLQPQLQKLHLQIHSFDLHSPHPLVTRADISSIPLPDGMADVSIFCLALMGTNWLDFIDEAYRITRWNGELWIAEIKSRFSRAEPASGPGNKKKFGRQIGDVKKTPSKEEQEQEEDDYLASAVDGAPVGEKTNVSGFVAALKRRGFDIAADENNGIDMSYKMFVKMRFVKTLKPQVGKNVGAVAEEDRRRGEKPEDKFKRQKKKGKFLEDVEDTVTPEEESKILKPCVYKLR